MPRLSWVLCNDMSDVRKIRPIFLRCDLIETGTSQVSLDYLRFHTLNDPQSLNRIFRNGASTFDQSLCPGSGMKGVCQPFAVVPIIKSDNDLWAPPQLPRVQEKNIPDRGELYETSLELSL